MTNFSFTDYIYRHAFGKSSSSDRGEAEVAAMEKAIGKRAPWDFDHAFSMRAMTAGTNSEGGYTVDDNVDEILDFGNLYQSSYWLSNATILDNLSGNISFPSKSTASVLTSGGVAETTSAANVYSTKPAFSSAKLTPKHIRVTIEVSQQLLDQTKSRGLDLLILNDIEASLSEELDRQIFKGDDSANEISAISGTAGVISDTWGDISSLSGGSASSKTIASEKSLGDSKVPMPYHFIINSETRAKLRSLRQAGLAYPIINERNEILGYPTYINESLADGDCWLIQPQNVVLGLFHPADMIDLIIDGRTKFNSGLVVLTASIMADASLIKSQALSVISES